MKSLLLGSGITGVLLAAVSVLSAPMAVAAPVDKTISYTCTIPIFGSTTLNIETSVDLPDTTTPGAPIQLGVVGVVVPIPADVSGSFSPFATQLDAALDYAIRVGDVTAPVHWDQSPLRQPIVPGSPTVFAFHGTVPPVTPTGWIVTVAAPTGFTLQLTPLDANGNPSILGTLTVPCTTTDNTTLGTIVIP